MKPANPENEPVLDPAQKRRTPAFPLVRSPFTRHFETSKPRK
nr:MAG TPA: hypothetical protein [Caudoviricetes sp.]